MPQPPLNKIVVNEPELNRKIGKRFSVSFILIDKFLNRRFMIKNTTARNSADRMSPKFPKLE